MVSKKLRKKARKAGRFIKKVAKVTIREAKVVGRGIKSVPEVKSIGQKIRNKVRRFRIEPPTIKTKTKRRSGAQRKKARKVRTPDPFADVLSTIKNL